MSGLNFGLKEEDLIIRRRIKGRAFISDRYGYKELIKLGYLCGALGAHFDLETEAEHLVESRQGLWKDLTEEEASAWIAEQNESRPWWKKLLTCFASRGD